MKREVLYGGLLACGVALMVLSLVLEGHVSDSIGGMFMGAGCGLMGFGGSQVLMRHREKRDPAVMRQAEIEAKDERNVAIREKAAYTSWYWSLYLLWGLWLLTLVTGGGMYVAFASVAIVLHCVFLMVNVNRWAKKL